MTDHGQTPWPAASTGADDDFSDFLDFHDVGLAFGDEATLRNASVPQPETLDFAQGDIAERLDASRAPATTPADYSAERINLETCLHQQSFSSHTHDILNDSQGNSNQTRHGSQSAQQHAYLNHGTVPRTPNTVEMHGAQVHAFTDPQALGLYEAGKHHDQMVFTPLASPAFQLHDFSTSSEYFSPLTSPALQAQDYGRLPISVSLGAEFERRDQGNPLASTKKSKRRSVTGAKDAVHKIRSSPAMKPGQKRRSVSSKTPREVSEMVTEVSMLAQASPGLSASNENSISRSKDTSETGSISPEPLSEVMMPPPAAPPSGSRGRSVQMNMPGLFSVATENGPATPASLFRITKPSITGLDGSHELGSQLHIAEAVADITKASSSDMPFQDSLKKEGASNVLLDGFPEPSKVRADSAKSSKEPTGGSQQAQPSPITGKDAMTSQRSTKKRSSSSHASPALRPRISPSIKPLLPGLDLYNSEATAALLANKSNYERIIDGSASQMGVTFPAQLSENLTSKRTSHKLAEQGRRNRINTALAEIQTLLPEGFGMEAAETSSCPSNANPNVSQVGGSKAKTVESAIEYIKTLQAQLVKAKSEINDMKSLVEVVKAENTRLKTSATSPSTK